MRLEDALAFMKDVPDFPKPGIIFKDITPILENAEAYRTLIEAMASSISEFKPHKIAAIEARGFILGAPIAYFLGCGLVMVRKKGKLPRKTRSARYDLEYGFDHLEIHEDSLAVGERVVLLDDVLATGGTLAATRALCEEAKAEVVGAQVLMELGFLKGRQKLSNLDVRSLIGR